ncbi:hypothetical protein GOC83_18875 [Haloarcula rubripromontorii]|uniref:Uncharacterized protein n=1 Tax=Haloarcula rubripromontorii TaxID=1705562 RepID=A0A847U9N4_9EURY|nr:hypothetical protein [Haloarcula rubripromontorii]NLV08190.1 hypothetical protein [Haloarcula rubripromontorii]
MNDDSDTNNPLEDLYVSKDEVDFEQLRDGLSGVVQIIKETGEPRPQSDFEGLSNKQQFVALMLYRRAAVELGHLDKDEAGASSGWFNEYIDVDSSRFSHYSSDLDFVENDSERGGYYIPGFDIGEAIDGIENE